jgi:hypothetical protein
MRRGELRATEIIYLVREVREIGGGDSENCLSNRLVEHISGCWKPARGKTDPFKGAGFIPEQEPSASGQGEAVYYIRPSQLGLHSGNSGSVSV